MTTESATCERRTTDRRPSCDAHPDSLTTVIDRMHDQLSGDSIRLRTLIRSFGDRAFGVVLVALSVLALIPIPVVPAIFAGLIVIVAVQMAMGAEHPWMPSRVLDRDMPADKVGTALQTIRPRAEWLDRNTSRRLTFLVSPPLSRVGAVAIGILAAVMIPLSVLPLIDFVLIAGMLLIAGSMVLRDGVMMMFGWAASVGLVVLSVHLGMGQLGLSG